MGADANVRSSKGSKEAMRRLQKFGEEFMAMFDDYEEQRPVSKAGKTGGGGRGARRKRRGGREEEEGGSSREQLEAAESAELASDGSETEGSESDKDEGGPDATSGEEEEEAEDEEDLFQGVRVGRGGGPFTAAKDEVSLEEKRRKGRETSSRAATSSGGQRSLPAALALPGMLQRQAGSQSAAASRRERKRFMSSKVGDIFATPLLPSILNADDEVDEAEMGDFQSIMREVSALGASQFQKKEKRKWEAEQLVNLGARAPKMHRIPASHAATLNTRIDKLKAKKLEEDIASGMVRVKGRSLKKDQGRKKRKFEPRGLKSSDGVFKGGVLHVRPPPKQSDNHKGGSKVAAFGMQGDSKLRRHNKKKGGKKQKKKRR